nr:MAG TPA: hypothetical protein [Caudoviricetes sp.]
MSHSARRARSKRKYTTMKAIMMWMYSLMRHLHSNRVLILR